MSQPRKMIHLPKVRMLRPGTPRGGLRITNVKAIRPPDPETVRRQEEERLRAELEKEIVSRSRSCANKTYECTLPVLSGRQYCSAHILKDPTAPYKQCAHTYGSGERCPQPAPTEQRDHRDQGLCFEHARIALHARQRSAAPPPPVTTTETLLNQLQHYVRAERVRTTSCASSVSVVSEHDADTLPAPGDPFKQIDATAVNAQYSSSIIECASGTDSDADSVTLGPTGSCRDVGTLGHSEDAPCEDAPLWRAGVYTAEEAVWSAKNSLRSLQSLYVRQMGRLRTLLQVARAQYLKAIKAEKEQYCSINSQARSGPLTVRERRQLRKLKAYAGYHRKHGVDALLARKLHHKRARVGGKDHFRGGLQSRCTFTEGGVRCSSAALPAAKHCYRHILLDRHQVLFTSCGDPRGCGSCGEAAARLPLPTLACRYHAAPPHYATFTLKKDETDSDSDSHSTSDGSQGDFLEPSDRSEMGPIQETPYE